jgi:anti-sigma-K factor RskA
MRRLAACATAVAAAAAVVLGILLSQHVRTPNMVLQTASGQPVGGAVMSRSDARNVSLALTARGLPVDRGQMFVLWAGDDTGTPMQVGRFMVDRRGRCRVHFNLPANHHWGRFWITRPGTPDAVVAST